MNPEAWNQFVLEHGPRSGRFLQSWEWGEFQKAAGERVVREEIVEEGKVVGVAQWLVRELSALGRYAFCPKGPILLAHPRDVSFAKRGAVFLRIEPEGDGLLVGTIKTIDMNPACTLLTDVSTDDEALLAAMHPKTRYNIRVASKHGVEVDIAAHDFESAWRLFEQTSSRGQFALHPRRYYETMLASLSHGDCRAFLATASRDGRLLAVNIVVDFCDTRTYLHGASANEHRPLMAPYLLHWELMRDAKSKGLHWYDWWGVAPVDAQKDHPWAGISRFKRGFGGEEVVSPGTHDLVLKPWRYRLYQFARRIRRTL